MLMLPVRLTRRIRCRPHSLDITDGVIGLLLNGCVVDGDGGGVTDLCCALPIAVELDGESLCPFCGQIIGEGVGKGDGSIGLNQA